MDELKSGVITRDEYFEWKINWPYTCDDCGKYEPKKQWRKKLLKLQTENLKWISVYLTYKVDTKSQMYR